MKTALITTTINVPRVLELYRKYGPDVAMFIAGDKHPRTPEIRKYCDGMEFVHFDDPERTEELDYKCSELIGWNCIQRRNIALLEAIKWGADVIVSIDDDNIPLAPDYFEWFEWWEFSGLKASSSTGWFDVGTLLNPISPHRGFPHDKKAAQPSFESTVGAKVGVAAGVCLGDPDISAVTRIANGPTVHGVSEVLRSGVVTDPKDTWTVFNTQNTAFIRELAPAMFCMPGVGRYDDIFASLICQRVMRDLNYHVHFGQPFVWQQRNSHDLLKDLAQELNGMRTMEIFAEYLDSPALAAKLAERTTALAKTRAIYEDMRGSTEFPLGSVNAALAFLDDMEKVL